MAGDSIFLETGDGWYKYVYRSSEIVDPTQVSVLYPVPNKRGEAATERIITLTSCHPLFSNAQRIISYGVFEGWYPRAGGAPAELASVTEAGAN